MNDAENWFFKKSLEYNNCWHSKEEKPWTTSLILYRIGQQLGKRFPGLVEKSIQRLLDEIHLVYDDLSTTLRITAALNRIEMQRNELAKLREFIMDNYSPSTMEPPDFLFFIRPMEYAHVKKVIS